MDANAIVDIITVGISLAVCIWIGLYYKKAAEKSFKSYFAAEGKLPLSVLTGTIMATFFSGVVIIGFGGENAVKYGIAMYWGVAGFIYLMRYPIFWVARIARIKFPPGVYTLPDLIGYYYGKATSGTSAILMLAYNMVRYATQMLIVGYLLRAVFGLETWLGVVIAALILFTYTMLSGIWAVAMTDFIQAIIMMIGQGLAVAWLWFTVGGFEGLYALLPASTWNVSGGQPLDYWIAVQLGVGMALWCAPEMYQRFISGKDAKTTTYSWCWTVVIWVVFTITVGLPGFIGKAYFPELAKTSVTDTVYAVYLQLLPIGLRGLWVATLIAATLSTASAHILLAGTNISRDIYQTLINKKASDQTLVKITRYSIPILGIITIIIALSFKSIFDIYTWGQYLMTAGLLIIVPGTLLWPRKISRYAGLPTILSGVLIFLIGSKPIGPLVTNQAYLAGWTASLIVFLVINLIGKKPVEIPPEEVQRIVTASKLQPYSKTVVLLGFFTVAGLTAGYMLSSLYRWSLFFSIDVIALVVMALVLLAVFFKEYKQVKASTLLKETEEQK